ncbi:MAG: hypothetical protein QXE31_00650 [Candidatus Woesearchaeota archaeon]
MGVFDKLFKKEIKEIQNNSSNIHQELHNELKKHHERLEKLNEYSQNLHKYIYYIEHSNTKHKKEIIEHINNVNKWIEYLNESHNNLKRELNDFKINIRKRLKEDLAYYHELIEEYLTFKINSLENKLEEYKKEHTKIVENKEKNEKIDIDTLKKSIKDEILKEISINNIKNTSELKENLELSKPEKDILRLMFNEGKPMTYEQIAEKLNKSVNSIRVYMNNIKLKKPIVEEFLTSNGIKVFSIKNSEMVKTLFNSY